MENKTIGGWKLNLSQKELTFSFDSQVQADEILNVWKNIFPQENTWVHRRLGVPSLIVRLDCFVDSDGKLEVYEVEERPAGIGITQDISPEFGERLSSVQETWPQFKSLISEKRIAHDDEMWLDPITLEDAMSSDDLLLIRAEPEECEFHSLQHRAVSTLLTKGNKSYGVHLGLWKEICSEKAFLLPWDYGFCLKPCQSSKCHGVEIFHPDFVNKKNKNKKKGIGGTSTKSRINRILSEYGNMYIQEFLEPPDCHFFQGNKMALRVFFGFDCKAENYKFLGGVWNSRPNLKIHGAADTIMGPVVG